MALLLDIRMVTVTLWKKAGINGEGNDSYSAPIQIRCRYQETSELFINSSGEQEMASTIINTEEAVLKVGDWVLLGEHVDAVPPTAARELKKVVLRRFATQTANVYKGVL